MGCISYWNAGLRSLSAEWKWLVPLDNEMELTHDSAIFLISLFLSKRQWMKGTAIGLMSILIRRECLSEMNFKNSNLNEGLAEDKA